MASYNKVILMGNLTRKPEVRVTQAGLAICKVGLAVNRRFKDASGEWKEEPTFVDVTIFGKRGEAFARYHDKGKVAFIEGSLRLDTWDDKQSGEKRSKLYVVADDWQFVGPGGPGSGGPPREAVEESGSSGGYAGYAPPAGEAEGGPAPFIDAVEDTPF